MHKQFRLYKPFANTAVWHVWSSRNCWDFNSNNVKVWVAVIFSLNLSSRVLLLDICDMNTYKK